GHCGKDWRRKSLGRSSSQNTPARSRNGPSHSSTPISESHASLPSQNTIVAHRRQPTAKSRTPFANQRQIRLHCTGRQRAFPPSRANSPDLLGQNHGHIILSRLLGGHRATPNRNGLAPPRELNPLARPLLQSGG